MRALSRMKRKRPILDDKANIAQVESVHESFENRRVSPWLEAEIPPRPTETETGMVQRNAAKPLCQYEDHVPIEKGPASIAVEQKQDRPLSFINIVDSVPSTSIQRLSKG